MGGFLKITAILIFTAFIIYLLFLGVVKEKSNNSSSKTKRCKRCKKYFPATIEYPFVNGACCNCMTYNEKQKMYRMLEHYYKINRDSK